MSRVPSQIKPAAATPDRETKVLLAQGKLYGPDPVPGIMLEEARFPSHSPATIGEVM
jgi:hypothetical protein